MELTRVQIPVASSGPSGRTNAYIIGTDEALLIDPADQTEELTATMNERRVTHIAVTHTHPDHVGGVKHYADNSDADVWARDGREDRFEDTTGVAPDRTFSEGTQIGPISVMESPGHAPDHVAFVGNTAALVGDVAFANTSVFVGGEDGDMRAYLTTLRRLIVGGFDVLHPGHGPEIDQPQQTLEWLISHRLARETRVLEAVQSGATTPENIVTVAYEGEDLTGVRRLARRTVEAHLEKLAVEGAITREGNQVRPT